MSVTYLLGVDLGGTKTSVSLGTDAGVLLDKIVTSTAATVEETVADIFRGLETLAAKHTVQAVAIGVSSGGPLDSEAGVIQSPPNLPAWRNIPITKLLSDHFGIPTFLENDANACALAEWYWGAGVGCDSLIFLTFGTGLGAGLILDKKLYRGASGLAGEVGHWRMANDGPECYYKKGSFESFASGCGINGLYKKWYGENLSAKEVCERAIAGEEEANRVIEKSAEMLGTGLAFLVDLLNVERIIIGSIYARNVELFKSRMEAVMETECLPQSFADCTVLPAGLGESLGDLAALGIARDAVR